MPDKGLPELTDRYSKMEKAKSFFEALLIFFVALPAVKNAHIMGRKGLERPSTDSLFTTVSSMLVPAHVLEHFEIWDAKEYKDRRVIEMREKEGVIPSELTGFDDIVFDGYANPVETLSHSFVCKPVWLNLYRRRYKRSNTDSHYTNEYDVSLKGVRMVPEPGLFLKDED